MNFVFGFLIITGIIVSMLTGNVDAVTNAALSSARSAVERAASLVGVFALWLGVAKVAEDSGFLRIFTRILEPFVRFLFPSIPKGHPAMGSILMNFSANLFGFGSAATPFGLKAMKELQQLNPNKEEASEAMCTFLAINVSSITLIPTTIIALRMEAGSADPMEIVGTTLFATSVSTLTAVLADYVFRKINRGRI